jgi:hypothetical protein
MQSLVKDFWDQFPAYGTKFELHPVPRRKRIQKLQGNKATFWRSFHTGTEIWISLHLLGGNTFDFLHCLPSRKFLPFMRFSTCGRKVLTLLKRHTARGEWGGRTSQARLGTIWSLEKLEVAGKYRLALQMPWVIRRNHLDD